jgi:hypothetical protein
MTGRPTAPGRSRTKAAKAHPWIKAMHRENRGFRKAGGGVVKAFYEGYDSILATDRQFMVKLDGDLSFVIEKNTVSHAQSLRSSRRKDSTAGRAKRRPVPEPRMGLPVLFDSYNHNG